MAQLVRIEDWLDLMQLCKCVTSAATDKSTAGFCCTPVEKGRPYCNVHMQAIVKFRRPSNKTEGT